MRDTDDDFTGRWFRVVKWHPKPRVRLLCFPHAGGAASFFRSWGELVPADVELISVCYPGREDRLLESPIGKMEHLVAPLVRECSRILGEPLAFFGHSMGASVAYETALHLEELYGTRLSLLAASGRPGPGHDQKSGDRGQVSDSELMRDVGLLGGTEDQAFEDPELRELILPAIRADYRLMEQYKPSASTLAARVIAYYGDADPDLDEAAVAAWSMIAGGGFEARSFAGGHFYLVDHAQEVLSNLFDHLDISGDGSSASLPS